MILMIAESLTKTVLNEVEDEGLNQFIAAIGLEDSPKDYTEYFKSINKKLNKIKNQLNNIERTVGEIKKGQTQIKISIEDAKLQQVLTQYQNSANVINQNFSSYNSATRALNSKDEKKKQKGTKLMYSLLQTKNIGEVEQAMFNISSYMFGEGIFKGILTYLTNLLDNNLTLATSKQKLRAKVFKRSCYNSFGVFDKFPSSYHETIKGKIVPQVNNALMVMLKGIILLESAYYKTIQQRQLFIHYKNINKLCNFAVSFWEKNTSFNKTSAKLKKLFYEYKTKVDNNLKDNYCWANESNLHPDPQDDGGIRYWGYPKEFKNYITVGWPFENPKHIYPPNSCYMIPPNFRFGKKSESVSFFEVYRGRNRWVGYYKSKESSRGQEPPKMPIPSLRDLVKAGPPTPELSQLSSRIRHNVIPQLKRINDNKDKLLTG